MIKNTPLSAAQQILDSIADGVFTIDTDWNITSFNKAAENITGTQRNDALGRKCWEVFHADVCERSCLLKKTINTEKQCINKTVHIVNRHGGMIPITISTALLKDNRGRVIGGVETFRDISEVEELRKEITKKYTYGDIITGDHRMIEIIEILPVVAQSHSPVLLLGESGTGKELFAKALHEKSGRSKKPFVAVNCGALPENLLESELFGYRKGAFTDAKSNKPGRFERASGGTLFLDEIGELPKSLQVKLLRVLQDNVYEPLGATEQITSTARIVAATNRNLEMMVSEGLFREDLFYRINVVPLTLPPLRERSGDISLLVDHFIRHYNIILKKNIEYIDSEAMEMLLSYTFPGNIRELENCVHHAFILCQGAVIEKKHLPSMLLHRKYEKKQKNISMITYEDFDRQTITEALVKNQYKRTAAAKALGIHPATLWRKMKKYDML